MAKMAMGELESAVMDVLWDAEGPMIPGEVHELLSTGRPLAYTTVMTILVRLWQKGRLEREVQGRAYAYRPVHTREEHAALRMAEVLVGTNDRLVALSYFVAGLKPAERTRLRRLLEHGKG